MAGSTAWAKAQSRWTLSTGPGAVAGEARPCKGELGRGTGYEQLSIITALALCVLGEEINVTHLPVL